MSGQLREFHTLGATGTVRAELHEGREHLVVPVIALMQGVIHAVNAAQAEFVPIECLAQSPYGWNGRPVVLGHPTRDGVQISANDPKVLAAHQFGVIFQSHIAGQKLGLEAWIDPKRLEALGQHELLADVRAGKPIEVSVGAFVKTLAEEGIYNGKAYKARWASLIPDHLAFLPKSRGACSIEMGCGAHRAAEMRAAGGPGSGWTTEGGHVPGSQEGASAGGRPLWKYTKTETEDGGGGTEYKLGPYNAIDLSTRDESEEKGFEVYDRRTGDAIGVYTSLDKAADAVIDEEAGSGEHSAKDIKASLIKLGKLKGLEDYPLYQLTDEGFASLGSPGSGWTAEGGHTPGSQGGKGGYEQFGSRGKVTGSRNEAREHERTGGKVRIQTNVPIGNNQVGTKYELIPKEETTDEMLERGGRRWGPTGNPSLGIGKKIRGLGGPGSGWHAEGGHVAGSQGGNHVVTDPSGNKILSRHTKFREALDEAEKLANSTGQAHHVGDLTTKKLDAAVHPRSHSVAGKLHKVWETSKSRQKYPPHDARVEARHASLADAAQAAAQYFEDPEKAFKVMEELMEENLETLGGPGSGWHAEDGHVPGSQGGTPGHMKAQTAHEKAAAAHEEAAKAVEYNEDSDDTTDASRKATAESHRASKATKETRAKPFSVQAASTYARNAQKESLAKDRAAAHREAAKYHRSAAKDHKIAASWGVKHLETRSLKERFLALISPFSHKLKDEDTEWLETLGGKKVDCTACAGSGSVSGNPCEACDGKGYTLKAMEGEEYPCEVHYDTLKTLIDDISRHWNEAADILTDLEEEEDAELRQARHDALITMLNEIMSAAGAAASLVYRIQHPQLDQASPRYAEELRTLIGARNSATDLVKIQTVHDYAVALGGRCDSMTAAEDHGGSTAEGDKMEKKDKDAIIKHLSECPCSGFTKEDVKFLEGLPDQRLEALEKNAKAGEKVQADLKAAEEKAKEQELKIKGLETKKLTEAELIEALPPTLKSLLEKAKTRETTRTAELLKALEEPTKGIFTPEELKLKSLEDLEKLATLAGLEQPNDFSAARIVPRAAGEADPLIPPDPYGAGVKALQEHNKTH